MLGVGARGGRVRARARNKGVMGALVNGSGEVRVNYAATYVCCLQNDATPFFISLSVAIVVV